MKWSDKTENLAAALAGFAAECPEIPKGSRADVKMKAGGSYAFDFADLATIRKTIRPYLARWGLSFNSGTEWPGSNDAPLHVTTRVTHKSGEWVEQTLAMFPNGGSPQEFGSVQTYATRYNVVALLGLAAEGEDDDGNAGSGNRANVTPRSQPQAPAATPKGPPTFGAVFCQELKARLSKLGMTPADLRRVMVDNGVDVAEVPSDDPATWRDTEDLYGRIKRYVETKLAKKETSVG